MTLADFALVVTMLVGLANLAGLLYLAGIKMGQLHRVVQDLDELEKRMEDFPDVRTKTNALWMFVARRGVVEASLKGFGETNSPFRVNERGMKAIKPLELQLQELGRSREKWDVPDLMAAIEQQMGDKMIREVCLPAGIHEGACMAIALCGALDTEVLELT